MAKWHVQAYDGMRHMLCLGCSVHVFGLGHSNRWEPNNWHVAYTKHVGFGGLTLLDVLFANGKCTRQAYSLAGHRVSYCSVIGTRRPV